MKVWFVNLCVFLQIIHGNSLIVPDELPSILSVIYSNIPTLKKGTDSRVGWGFRLGDRADFQVLTEYGPQTYTQPLANQGDNNSNNKRDAVKNLGDLLYAQRHQEQRIKEQSKNKQSTDDPVSDGQKWLQKWSQSVKKTQENEALPLKPRPGLGIGEIDAKSVIPEDTVNEPQKNQQRNIKATTTEESALDDVSLD